ncbi:MAG TPA: glycosyltransferase family 39 protein [Bacteroidia bacterium]|nr:glycosyltransferase family 39 protein [Bacteroidia bacterium]HNU34288.1 glycosyltransferase family 39 protein [Bacteroidia bacterium]
MFRKISLFKTLIVVLLICFTAKIFAGYKLQNTFLQRGNSKTFLNLIAYNLVLHDEFSVATGIPSVDYEPLYPMLMSAAYKITGNDWIALTFIQALLHLLTSLLVFFLTKRIWNEIAGFIAALYHAFYPYLFTYSLSIYDTTMFVFLLVSLVFLTIRTNFKISHLAGIGICLGLGLLTRGTTLTFIPPVLMYVAYIAYKNGGFIKMIKQPALIILVMFLTLSPWLMRNYNYTKRIAISTHGPFGLWQGNNSYTEHYLSNNISLDEIYRLKPPPDIYAKYPMQQRMPEDAVLVADAYKEEARNWITENPETFIRLAFIKAQKLWTWNRNPFSSNPVYGSNEGRSTTYLISYLPLLLTLPFGLFLLVKGKWEYAVLIILILLSFTAAHMIAMGFTRARIPIDFLLMICFGIAVSWVLKKVFFEKFKR